MTTLERDLPVDGYPEDEGPYNLAARIYNLVPAPAADPEAAPVVLVGARRGLAA